MSFFATSFDRVCYLCQNYTCNFDNGLHNDGLQAAASIDMHFTQKNTFTLGVKTFIYQLSLPPI